MEPGWNERAARRRPIHSSCAIKWHARSIGLKRRQLQPGGEVITTPGDSNPNTRCSGVEVYGMPIAAAIEESSGRTVALGSISATLDRLEQKGLVVVGRSARITRRRDMTRNRVPVRSTFRPARTSKSLRPDGLPRPRPARTHSFPPSPSPAKRLGRRPLSHLHRAAQWAVRCVGEPRMHPRRIGEEGPLMCGLPFDPATRHNRVRGTP
jgi:hypothetical protein